MKADIEAAGQEVKSLAAEIKGGEGRVATLGAEVKSAEADRKSAEESLKEATALRKKEHDDFAAKKASDSEDLQACDQAIAVLRKTSGNPKAAFLQSRMDVEVLKRAINHAPGDLEMEKESVLSFLSSEGAFNTADIIGRIEQMRDSLAGDNADAQAAEDQAQQHFDELKAELLTSIETATATIEDKREKKGNQAVKNAENKGRLEDMDRKVAADREFAANMQADCATKQKEFDERIKNRNIELVAVSEAIKMLNDDDALDMFKKSLKTTSFLQIVDDTVQQQSLDLMRAAQEASLSHRHQISLVSYAAPSRKTWRMLIYRDQVLPNVFIFITMQNCAFFISLTRKKLYKLCRNIVDAFYSVIGVVKNSFGNKAIMKSLALFFETHSLLLGLLN